MGTIAAVELFFVVFFPVPFLNENGVFFEPDPFTGHRPKSKSIGYFRNGVIAHINTHGYRDDNFALQKEAGSFRVLVIGDSFTFGNNVNQDQVYPKVLEDLLSQRYEGKIEVINAGVGAWEPFQYYQYYEHYGKHLAPDLIIIGFFVGNDTYDQITSTDQLGTAVMGVLVSRKAADSKLIKVKMFLYEKSHIARLIMRKRIMRGTIGRRNCEQFTDFFISVQRARIKNHLRRDEGLYKHAGNSVYQIDRIKKSAEQDSIPLMVILIPDENQINPALQEILLKDDEVERYDFTMPQSMLMEMFRSRGINTIDLLPHFIKDSRCLYMNDTHWTPEGHELAASAVYEKITPFLTGRVREKHLL